MYKLRILSSLLLSKTPNYPGRSFIKSRIEGLEYSILFSFIDNSKKLIKYRSTKTEQKNLIFHYGIHYGRMCVIVDDLQDENKVLISDKILLDLLMLKEVDFPNYPLLKSLNESLQYIKSSLKTANKNNYLKCISRAMSSQRLKDNEDIAKTALKKSEEKGSAFVLALVNLLDPVNLDENIVKALSLGGSWGQIIDDYADYTKDKKHSIQTVFTLSDNPKKLFLELSCSYKKRIFELTQREDFIIPFAEDIADLAKISKLPIVNVIYSTLNN